MLHELCLAWNVGQDGRGWAGHARLNDGRRVAVAASTATEALELLKRAVEHMVSPGQLSQAAAAGRA